MTSVGSARAALILQNPGTSFSLPESEESKDEQHDNDGTDDVDDLMHEILLYMDGSSEETPETVG